MEHSEYARKFEDNNVNWTKDPERNKLFLKCQQNYFNLSLSIRGHVFLNEIYDALGFPRSGSGAIVGWMRDPEDEEETYIDFQVDEDGYIDFNVDGVIYDKLDG